MLLDCKISLRLPYFGRLKYAICEDLWKAFYRAIKEPKYRQKKAKMANGGIIYD